MSIVALQTSPQPRIPDLKGIELAIRLSISSMLSGGLSGSVNEESTTGSLLGAIASHVRWLNHVTQDSMPRCHWTQYRKGGRDLSSESWTGSDFSLILRIEEYDFRAATFQAKRSKNSRHGFNTVQISPAKGNFRPEPQLIRMLRHSASYQSIQNINRVVSNATWLHFLTYGVESIKHLPLSLMKQHCVDLYQFDEIIKKTENSLYRKSGQLFTIREIRKKWRAFSPHVFSPEESLDFIELIACGTGTPCDITAPGWQTLQGQDAAKAFILATAPHRPVFEAAAGSDYSPIIVHSKSMTVSQVNDIGIDEALIELNSNDIDNSQAAPTNCSTSQKVGL